MTQGSEPATGPLEVGSKLTSEKKPHRAGLRASGQRPNHTRGRGFLVSGTLSLRENTSEHQSSRLGRPGGQPRVLSPQQGLPSPPSPCRVSRRQGSSRLPSLTTPSPLAAPSPPAGPLPDTAELCTLSPGPQNRPEAPPPPPTYHPLATKSPELPLNTSSYSKGPLVQTADFFHSGQKLPLEPNQTPRPHTCARKVSVQEITFFGK